MSATRRPKKEATAEWRGIPLARPAALDLYCCGGGAGRGLLAAGYKTVIGIDCVREHKPTYESAAPGMRFVLGDGLELIDHLLR